MGQLPSGYARQIANSQDIEGRERAKDGSYIFVVRKVSYESTKKGSATIAAHRVLEATKTNAAVEPNAVGSNVSYFMPDYGEAKVMMMPNLKAYLCKLLGINPKTTPSEVIEKAIDEMTSDSQPARGMLIKGQTFHTTKKNDGSDFLGFNWENVPGPDNQPGCPAVLARRAQLDAEDGGAAKAVGGSAPSIPGAPAIPGAPSIPSIPGAKPFPPAGWVKHPSNSPGGDGSLLYFKEGANPAQFATENELKKL